MFFIVEKQYDALFESILLNLERFHSSFRPCFCSVTVSDRQHVCQTVNIICLPQYQSTIPSVGWCKGLFKQLMGNNPLKSCPLQCLRPCVRASLFVGARACKWGCVYRLHRFFTPVKLQVWWTDFTSPSPPFSPPSVPLPLPPPPPCPPLLSCLFILSFL